MNDIKTKNAERGIRGEQSSFIKDQAAFVAESKPEPTEPVHLTEEEIGSILSGLMMIGPLDRDGVNDIGDPLEVGSVEALLTGEAKLEASLKGFPPPVDIWFARKFLSEEYGRCFAHRSAIIKTAPPSTNWFGCTSDKELETLIRKTVKEVNENDRKVHDTGTGTPSRFNHHLIADLEEPVPLEAETKVGLQTVLTEMLHGRTH